MKKKVALHNLGCKVNAYETEAMGQLFEKRGYEIVPFGKEADIYIINTCTVTNVADRKSRQMLHKAKKMNENSLVVAVGCYAQAFSKELEKDELIDIIVGNDRKKEIVDIVEQNIKETIIDINDTSVAGEFEELNIESIKEHTRAYIKIQDGCNQFCSYCIIPYARGRIRSRRPENIMKEIGRLTDAGYQEVVLTGIHLTSYGKDFEDGISLIDIIEMIGKIPEIKRIRLGSLEPRVITDEFMRRLTKVQSFCPHFHLSLQSGCDETLKRMNRKYTCSEYMEGCETIRKYYEDAAITTDVIVGFPEESDEEFEVTKKYLRDVNFAQMHIFKYSKREGTVAAANKNQVDDRVKSARSDVLIKLGREMHLEFMNKYLGKKVPVLFEEIIKVDSVEYYMGHTMEYLKVAVKTDKNLQNQILEVEITQVLNNEIVLAIL